MTGVVDLLRPDQPGWDGLSGEADVERTRPPVLVYVVALLLFAMQSVAVLPGPLRSNGSPLVMTSYLMAGLVLVGALHRRGDTGRTMPTPSVGLLVLAVYLVARVGSFAVGQYHGLDSLAQAESVRQLLFVTGLTGVAWFVAARLRHIGQVVVVLRVLVAGLAFTAVVGALQFVGGPDLRGVLVPPGFVVASDRVIAVRDGLSRAIGTNDNPIEFGVVLAAGVPLALFTLRWARTGWGKLAAATALVLVVAAVPLSVSRTAILGVGAALLVVAVGSAIRRTSNLVAVTCAALAALLLVAPSQVSLFYGLFSGAGQDDSITGRVDDYGPVFQQFQLHPLLGTGIGSNPATQTRFLDNQWLQEIVQGGLVGVLTFALLVVALVARLVTRASALTDPMHRDLALALLAAVTAVVVSSFTFDLLGFRHAAYLLFLLYGLSWSRVLDTSDVTPRHHVRARRSAAVTG